MSGAERQKEWISSAEGLNPEMAEEGRCGVHVLPSIFPMGPTYFPVRMESDCFYLYYTCEEGS